MKKIFIFLTSLFWLVTLVPNLSFGQESNEKHIRHRYDISGDLEKEDIELVVKEKTSYFNIEIRSTVREGILLVEIYSPDKERQGYFSIGSMRTTNEEQTQAGNFSKRIKNPSPGNWSIKIIPNGVNGNISISTSKSYNKE